LCGTVLVGSQAMAAKLGENPFSGVVVVFRAKRADRVKILIWDASGLVLMWKQLQQGAFRWPPVVDGAMRLSAVEFAALFDGLDWTRVQKVRRIPTRVPGRDLQAERRRAAALSYRGADPPGEWLATGAYRRAHALELDHASNLLIVSTPKSGPRCIAYASTATASGATPSRQRAMRGW
jgi:transposase